MSRHIEKIKRVLKYNENNTKTIIENILKFKNQDMLVIYNPECLGITSATKDLFSNIVAIKEILNEKEIEEISKAIIDSNVNQVIFSSITFGFQRLIETIKIAKHDIKIKFLWHGSHSLFVMANESTFLYSIIDMLDRGLVYSIAFSKESMAKYYKLKGYNSFFLPNTTYDLHIDNDIKLSKEENKSYIGLYSAGDRWEKNTFNQLSAISLIDNSVVDLLPVTPLVKSYCEMMNIKIRDINISYMPRKELLTRMSQNDINLYVTFTECSPVVPLESLDLGVPCITGNNHHYFKNSKLYDYLVVQSEDNIDEITEKIKLCIANKSEILELYRMWKIDYDIECKEYLKAFIES